MGIINDFFKKFGLKSKRPLLQEGDSSENATASKINEISDTSEKFNNSLKFTPATAPQLVQEVSTDAHESDPKRDPVLKVFAERGIDSAQIDYVVNLETESGSLIPISVIRENTSGVSLKEIVGEISKVISAWQNSSSKDDTTKRQAEIKEKMKHLNERYKVNFTRNMVSIVENADIGSGLDYQKFERLLSRNIDIKSLTPTEIVQYGKMLTQRLGVLDSIKTPEDAYKTRVSLESFMKSQEKQTAHSAIIAANLDNLESGEQALDLPTIIAFAKKLETISNEDGLLYSSYLKLEENRIIRKLQKDLSSYQQGLQDAPENLSTSQVVDSLIEYLDSTKVTTGDDISDNITAYMIDTIQGRGIENYAKNSVRNDIRLKVFLQHNPIDNQQEALNYVVAKMACFGQVVATPESEEYKEKIRKLRDFIEVTDYKDEDDSESKDFLYTIVQIERDYIKKNYSPILHEFQKIVEGQSK